MAPGDPELRVRNAPIVEVDGRAAVATRGPARGGPPFQFVVDLDAVALNMRAVRAWVPPDVGVLAVVKADAYGLGALHIAPVLAREGAAGLGVANVQEGVALRQVGVTQPIVVLGQTYGDEASEVAEHRLTATVSSLAQAHRLSREGGSRRRRIRVHLEVDTGLGRSGLAPDHRGVATARRIAALSGVRLEGAFTHFASAESDPRFTARQLARFSEFVVEMSRAGTPIPLTHVANSAALMRRIGLAMSMVRPGMLLYGAAPDVDLAGGRLRPHDVVTFRSSVVGIRSVEGPVGYGAREQQGRRKIATMPVGFSAGYPRTQVGGEVLLNGVRCPIVGPACMNHLMVDATTVPRLRLGDPAVLVGSQDGQRITVGDVARRAGTIPTDVLCSLGATNGPIYLRGEHGAAGE